MNVARLYEEVQRLRAEQAAVSWRLAQIRENAMREIRGKPRLFPVIPEQNQALRQRQGGDGFPSLREKFHNVGKGDKAG